MIVREGGGRGKAGEWKRKRGRLSARYQPKNWPIRWKNSSADIVTIVK